jgi:hypothetical protein
MIDLTLSARASCCYLWTYHVFKFQIIFSASKCTFHEDPFHDCLKCCTCGVLLLSLFQLKNRRCNAHFGDLGNNNKRSPMLPFSARWPQSRQMKNSLCCGICTGTKSDTCNRKYWFLHLYIIAIKRVAKVVEISWITVRVSPDNHSHTNIVASRRWSRSRSAFDTLPLDGGWKVNTNLGLTVAFVDGRAEAFVALRTFPYQVCHSHLSSRYHPCRHSVATFCVYAISVLVTVVGDNHQHIHFHWCTGLSHCFGRNQGWHWHTPCTQVEFSRLLQSESTLQVRDCCGGEDDGGFVAAVLGRGEQSVMPSPTRLSLQTQTASFEEETMQVASSWQRKSTHTSRGTHLMGRHSIGTGSCDVHPIGENCIVARSATALEFLWEDHNRHRMSLVVSHLHNGYVSPLHSSTLALQLMPPNPSGHSLLRRPGRRLGLSWFTCFSSATTVETRVVIKTSHERAWTFILFCITVSHPSSWTICVPCQARRNMDCQGTNFEGDLTRDSNVQVLGCARKHQAMCVSQ